MEEKKGISFDANSHSLLSIIEPLVTRIPPPPLSCFLDKRTVTSVLARRENQTRVVVTSGRQAQFPGFHLSSLPALVGTDGTFEMGIWESDWVFSRVGGGFQGQ